MLKGLHISTIDAILDEISRDLHLCDVFRSIISHHYLARTAKLSTFRLPFHFPKPFSFFSLLSIRLYFSVHIHLGRLFTLESTCFWKGSRALIGNRCRSPSLIDILDRGRAPSHPSSVPNFIALLNIGECYIQGLSATLGFKDFIGSFEVKTFSGTIV